VPRYIRGAQSPSFGVRALYRPRAPCHR